MKMKKLLAFALIFILIFPSISLNASSQEESDNKSNNEDTIIHKLLRLRFNIGFIEPFGRYFMRQLRPPVPIQAYPESVSLKYLNETTFMIGGRNKDNTDWEKVIKLAGTWNWAWMNRQIVYTFEFVPPENTSKDIWNVEFNPEKIVLIPNRKNLDWPGAEAPLRTNVSIMLKPNVDPRIVTQDVVLKVNIVREEVLDKLGILKGVPEFVRTHKEEYIRKCEELDVPAFFYLTPIMIPMYNLLSKYSIFLMNLQLPFYDKWVDSTVEVLTKVDKFHLAEIKSILPQEIEPYQAKSIPITIRNIGSHIDTYNFRVRCNDENMVVTPPPALTLKPGEEGQALVGVAAPKRFLSVGTTTSIFVEAYSVEDPDKVFSNTIILKTTGIHVAGGAIYTTILLLTILVIVVGLYLYLSKKRREKICKKPEKPWTIPKENEYLEKLKQKDKKKFEETMQMMQEEYQSSLLWYKHYCRSILQKRKLEAQKERQHIKDLKRKAKAKEKKKEEIKKIEEKKPKEPEKEEIIPKEPKIEEKRKPVVDKKAEMERRRKEQVLLRIKREQEKQKRKVGSSI